MRSRCGCCHLTPARALSCPGCASAPGPSNRHSAAAASLHSSPRVRSSIKHSPRAHQGGGGAHTRSPRAAHELSAAVTVRRASTTGSSAPLTATAGASPRVMTPPPRPRSRYFVGSGSSRAAGKADDGPSDSDEEELRQMRSDRQRQQEARAEDNEQQMTEEGGMKSTLAASTAQVMPPEPDLVRVMIVAAPQPHSPATHRHPEPLLPLLQQALDPAFVRDSAAKAPLRAHDVEHAAQAVAAPEPRESKDAEEEGSSEEELQPISSALALVPHQRHRKRSRSPTRLPRSRSIHPDPPRFAHRAAINLDLVAFKPQLTLPGAPPRRRARSHSDSSNSSASQEPRSKSRSSHRRCHKPPNDRDDKLSRHRSSSHSGRHATAASSALVPYRSSSHSHRNAHPTSPHTPRAHKHRHERRHATEAKLPHSATSLHQHEAQQSHVQPSSQQHHRRSQKHKRSRESSHLLPHSSSPHQHKRVRAESPIAEPHKRHKHAAHKEEGGRSHHSRR